MTSDISTITKTLHLHEAKIRPRPLPAIEESNCIGLKTETGANYGDDQRNPLPMVMSMISRVFIALIEVLQRWGLWLETLWFLGINAAVGYMFLYKGFEWESERGMVQRFMW